MFALHTMMIDAANDNYILGGVTMFKTMEKAVEERDCIIDGLKEDYEIDEGDIAYDGNETTIPLNSDSFYTIRIEEVEEAV